MQGEQRRSIDELTGLRGLAALWVALYHLRTLLPAYPDAVEAILGHGYLAVDIFFALSGFILYTTYFEKFRTLSPRGYVQFVIKRLARIYPAHAATMLLFLMLPVAILLFSEAKDLGDRYDPGDYVLALLLVQNWGFTDNLNWNFPSWSISTEFFAYLLFPFLALAFQRVLRSIVGGLIVSAAAYIAVFLVFDLNGEPSLSGSIPTLGLPRCVLEFIAGMAAASLFARIGSNRRHAVGWAALAASAGLFASLGFGVQDYAVAPLAGSLLVAGLACELPAFRGLRHKAAVYLGEISYSIYILHIFIRELFQFVLTDATGEMSWLVAALYVVVLIAGAAVMYELVEKPVRGAVVRWSAERFSRKRVDTAAREGQSA